MTTLIACVGTRFRLGPAATLFAITATAIAPRAGELGHHHYHDSDYRHWKQPGTGISCCSDHDSTPVRAELRQGRCFALRQRELTIDEMGLPVWQALERSEWIEVPDEKILRVRNPAVESGHLCYSEDKVVCFVPPHTGG